MEAVLDKQRFIEVWKACAKPSADLEYAERIFKQLNRFYGHPARFYHTAKHIAHCLQQYDLGQASNGNAPNVELAIWMHDAIYEADSRINESRSAQWFREKAHDHIDAGTINKIANLILITQHKVLPKTPEEKYIIDVDLSSFGMEWPIFPDVRVVAHILIHKGRRRNTHAEI